MKTQCRLQQDEQQGEAMAAPSPALRDRHQDQRTPPPPRRTCPGTGEGSWQGKTVLPTTAVHQASPGSRREDWGEGNVFVD